MPGSASPDRQAVASIHLSSCPTLSSPRWLVWQGIDNMPVNHLSFLVMNIVNIIST